MREAQFRRRLPLMDLFNGESSSPQSLRGSTSRLTLSDASSSPAALSHSPSKRSFSFNASESSAASHKRVKVQHTTGNSSTKAAQSLSLASLQSSATPEVLLAWAHQLVISARARLNQLTVPRSSSQSLSVYHADIKKAIVCLRAVVDPKQVLKPEMTLEAMRMLSDVLLTDADVREPRNNAQIKDLLRRGLTIASGDLRWRKFKLAFQELQIRLWVQEGDASSKKLANKEAKRISSEFPTST